MTFTYSYGIYWVRIYIQSIFPTVHSSNEIAHFMRIEPTEMMKAFVLHHTELLDLKY